jgi:hypothetical protein
MSLIFEALKKLEREKQAPDRGLVVVGPGALHHPAERGSGRTWLAAGAGAALALLGVLGVLLLRGGAAPAVAPTPAPTLAAVAVPAAQVAVPQAAAPQAAMPPATLTAATVPVPTAPAVAPAAPRPISTETARESREAVGTRPAAPAPRPAATLVPAPPQAAFTLHAISQRDGQPVAIINERLVHEGDSFDGVKVLRIGAAEVEIEVRGERRVLTF